LAKCEWMFAFIMKKQWRLDKCKALKLSTVDVPSRSP
jgi:hypothetical protein